LENSSTGLCRANHRIKNHMREVKPSKKTTTNRNFPSPKKIKTFSKRIFYEQACTDGETLFQVSLQFMYGLVRGGDQVDRSERSF